VGGRHTYDRVLPGALKGSFATLLSPPQCRAAFGMMPHTLGSVDLFDILGCYPPQLRGRQGLDFGRDLDIYICEISSSHGGEYDVQNCLL
jgi:hypothetical protein